MHSLWDELVRSRTFWEACVCGWLWLEPRCPTLDKDKAFGEQPRCEVNLGFKFPEWHSLRVSVNVAGLQLEHWDYKMGVGAQTLAQVESGGKEHFFRWEEFQAIVRHLSKDCSPAWAVELLFCPFVAVTAEILDKWTVLVRRCLEAAGVFTSAEIEHIIADHRSQCGPPDLRWVNKPGVGWAIDSGGYSRRRDDKYSEFDFARFNRFLQVLPQNA